MPSADFDIDSIENTSGQFYTCNSCGYNWISRKKNGIPLTCPKCRSINWNKKCQKFKCQRCNHIWNSTKEHPPRCPKCHTSRWDQDSYPKSLNREITQKEKEKIENEIKKLYSEGKTILQISMILNLPYQSVYDVLKEQ